MSCATPSTRAHRHGPARPHRHAGPAAGQALARARHFVDEVAAHGAEALQLPARRRRRDEHRRRLRDGVVGPRLRRLRDAPGPRHAAAGPVAGGHGAVPGRPRLGRRQPTSSPRRARSCAASSTGSPSAAGPPTPAPSSSSSSSDDTYEEAWDSGLPRPRPGQPLQRRLLAAGHRARRAAAPPHPQRDGRRRAARSRTPRASATSASTRSTSATSDALRTADDHAIYKNGAKEIAAQEGMAITFMAKFDEREGNSCHIHLSLADATTGDNALRRRRRAVRPLPRRPARRRCAS